jgi:hypothetical protein
MSTVHKHFTDAEHTNTKFVVGAETKMQLIAA